MHIQLQWNAILLQTLVKEEASLPMSAAGNLAEKLSSHMHVMELGLLSCIAMEMRQGGNEQLVQVKIWQVPYQSNCTSGHTDFFMDFDS